MLIQIIMKKKRRVGKIKTVYKNKLFYADKKKLSSFYSFRKIGQYYRIFSNYTYMPVTDDRYDTKQEAMAAAKKLVRDRKRDPRLNEYERKIFSQLADVMIQKRNLQKMKVRPTNSQKINKVLPPVPKFSETKRAYRKIKNKLRGMTKYDPVLLHDPNVIDLVDY